MSYIEYRHADQHTTAMATDIACHIQSRQHLGKAIIVCEKPVILMSMVRKHWLKLARSLQKERSGTINAERILRLTNKITHMHRMNFVSKLPEEQPHAHAYFIHATQTDRFLLPINSYSLYVTAPIAQPQLHVLIRQLPSDALVVDYAANMASLLDTLLKPKHLLEEKLNEEQHVIADFLTTHHIQMNAFHLAGRLNVEAIDDALDTLLGVSYHFLYLANNFQRAYELAQPFTLPESEQQQYSAIMLLAHRVQALNPAAGFHQKGIYELTEDETFFLHDISEGGFSIESMMQHAIERHKAAGRLRLARALLFTMS